MSSARVIGHFLSKLPFIFNVIIFIWIESSLLGLVSLFVILSSFRSSSVDLLLMAGGIIAMATVVLNFLMIRQTRDFTVDFYMSKDWKRERRALLREREAGDPDRPDFSKLKRFCIVTASCSSLLGTLMIIAMWTGYAPKEFTGFENAFRYSIIVFLLRCLNLFYIGWTWYTIAFITKYRPPQRAHLPTDF